MSGKIGSGALHLTFSKILTMLLSLITGMLLSRFRTVGEYGTYSQIMIAINTATALIMMGLPSSTNYFLARADSHEEKRDFLSVYYSINTVLCMVLGAVLVAIIPLVERFFNNDTISNFAYFFAIYPWAHITIISISNVLVVYDKTKRLILVNLAVSFVSLASIIIIQIFSLSFADYMLAFLIGNVILALAVYVIIGRLERGFRVKFDIALIKKIFVYSIPIGLASVVGTLSIEMDKLMIGRFMDTESLAIYTNAGKELPLTIVASSLTAVLLPQMAKYLKEKENMKAVELWGTAIRLSYIIICFFVTACIVFAPQVLTLLYSEKYIDGVQVFRIYSFVLLLRTTYFGMVLNSIGKTKFIFWSSIISLGLNVALNYLLYKLFGFIGPALATVISILLVNALQLILTAKSINVPFSKVFPWKKLLKISLVNMAWGVVSFIVVKLLGLGIDSKGIIISVVLGAIITVFYLLIERKEILSLWKKLNGKE